MDRHDSFCWIWGRRYIFVSLLICLMWWYFLPRRHCIPFLGRSLLVSVLLSCKRKTPYDARRTDLLHHIPAICCRILCHSMLAFCRRCCWWTQRASIDNSRFISVNRPSISISMLVLPLLGSILMPSVYVESDFSPTPSPSSISTLSPAWLQSFVLDVLFTFAIRIPRFRQWQYSISDCRIFLSYGCSCVVSGCTLPHSDHPYVLLTSA